MGNDLMNVFAKNCPISNCGSRNLIISYLEMKLTVSEVKTGDTISIPRGVN